MQRIDKYEVLETIGRGAMGTVYKAFHPHLKKYVAIKEILADLSQNPDIQARFAREAELLAQLPAHPNIVMVRDALVHENKLYLVMDYVEGGMLSDVIKQGPIEIPRALDLLNQILSGLEAIHSRGIIHRDLKASNILLGKDGTAFISDFGIAESARFAPRGDAMATAKCVAPELIDPAVGRNATPPQADIYAAGILAYEMLLGETRFRQALPEIYRAGDSNQIAQNWMAWHTDLSRPAPNLSRLDPNIPTALAGIVERMMSKDATARYQNARDIRRDLAAITKGNNAMNDVPQRPASDDATVPLSQLRQQPSTRQPQPAPPPTPVAPVPAPVNRKSKISTWALLGAGGAALFLLLAAALLAMQRPPGFTIVIQGVAPNAEVYVADIRRGIPAIGKAKDGSPVEEIHVAGLKAGEHYKVSVKSSCGDLELSRDGNKVNESQTGDNGDTIVLQAGKCGVTEAKVLPDEIDYHGKMRLVKAGPFLMGAQDNDSRPNESPVHPVNLNYDYYIDKFEVTNKEYAAFCKETKHDLPKDPGWDLTYFSKYPNSPVVGVTYDDARAYANWAGKELPTEEEWEKAASWDPNATGLDPKFKRKWPWGSAPDKKANFGTEHASDVGKFKDGASAYGVMDMAGNVGEWVLDDYRPYPNSTAPASDFPPGMRIVRGGGFVSPEAKGVRTTQRIYTEPNFSQQVMTARSFITGFRCAVRADKIKKN